MPCPNDALGQRVLLVANEDKPAALEVARAARAVIEAEGWKPEAAGGREGPIPCAGARLAVVFGGDGTVLAALHRLMAGLPSGGEGVAGQVAPLPPVLGVNLGRLGYLAEAAPGDLRELLPLALRGRLPVSERALARTEIWRGDALAWSGHAVNEALVASAVQGRAARLEARVDGELVMAFCGDGLLAATPTGSTAHALSAGGPVLSGAMRALALVPVCPHRLSLRPLVAGSGETVEMRPAPDPEGRLSGRDTPCLLSMDGHFFRPLGPGDAVRVRVADFGWTLIRRPGGAYGVLRRKFGWDGG